MKAQSPKIPAALRRAFHAALDELLERLRVCEGCGDAFLDGTKNRSQRWCDPKTCGNRAKVRSFRSRHRPTKGREGAEA